MNGFVGRYARDFSQVGMLEYCLTVVDGGDFHLARLILWVFFLRSCVTNSKDIHKVQLSIIMRYYV